MWNTFKYTLLTLTKERNILIWALAFSLILATIFNFMFADLDNAFSFKPISVGILDDDAYQENDGFKEMIEELSKEGDDQMLVPHYVSDRERAQELLKEGTIIGYYSMNDEGKPELSLTFSQGGETTETVNQTILDNILNSYVHTSSAIEQTAEVNPLALQDPSTLDKLSLQKSYTTEVSLLANTASSTVRYFYALLGFAAIMAANVAMTAITRTQANLSALGARRAVGATSRTKTMISTLLACWLLAFVCLLLAYCYMRFILQVSFGDRDLACIFGLLIASFMATGLGATIGAIPKVGGGVKGGILTGLSCFLALFAGLYGTSSQTLADDLTREMPFIQLINPSKQVTDLFYSLYFYDGYEQFFSVVVVLLIISVFLFIIAAVLMRRQRYAAI